MNSVTRESFLADITNHVMTVVSDDGVNRIIRCANPNTTSQSFTVATTPSYISYFGDMGCFVFGRNATDMLAFFNTDKAYSNYWHEKLVGTDRPHGDEEFSPDEFKTILDERVLSLLDDIEGVTEKDRELLQEEINDLYCQESEHEAMKSLDEFEFELPDCGETITFEDVWEWIGSSRAYTPRYLWCCHALNWVANQYFAKGGTA